VNCSHRQRAVGRVKNKQSSAKWELRNLRLCCYICCWFDPPFSCQLGLFQSAWKQALKPYKLHHLLFGVLHHVFSVFLLRNIYLFIYLVTSPFSLFLLSTFHSFFPSFCFPLYFLCSFICLYVCLLNLFICVSIVPLYILVAYLFVVSFPSFHSVYVFCMKIMSYLKEVQRRGKYTKTIGVMSWSADFMKLSRSSLDPNIGGHIMISVFVFSPSFRSAVCWNINMMRQSEPCSTSCWHLNPYLARLHCCV